MRSRRSRASPLIRFASEASSWGSGQPWLRILLLLLKAVLLWMELTMDRSSGGFPNKARPLVFCCIFFFDLPPLASGMRSVFDGGLASFIRRPEARFYGGTSGAEELVLLRRSGCGKKDWRVGSEVLRGDLLAATCGVHQRWRACTSVILGRGSHSMLWCLQHQSVFNLQAGVPLWRPFFSSDVASFVAPSPSGHVPGYGVDGRCVELFVLGGVGPDCIPISLVKVLFVIARDLVVIFFFFEVLVVICNPTV